MRTSIHPMRAPRARIARRKISKEMLNELRMKEATA